MENPDYILSSTFHLVSGIQNGEKSAFDALIEKYSYVGRKWLEHVRLPNLLTPDDVVNEVFLDLLKAKNALGAFEYRSSGSFRNYFFVVIRRKLKALHAKHLRTMELESNAEPLHECEFLLTDVENSHWRVNLIRVALTEWMTETESGGGNTRPVMLLYEVYLNEMKLKDAALKLGISESLAKKYHRQGKAVLQSRILWLIRGEAITDADYLSEVVQICGSDLGEQAMKCPLESDIRSHLLGFLDAEEEERVRKHVNDCPVCKPRLLAVSKDDLGRAS